MKILIVNRGYLLNIQMNIERLSFTLSLEELTALISPVATALGLDEIEPIATNHQAALIVYVLITISSVSLHQGFS